MRWLNWLRRRRQTAGVSIKIVRVDPITESSGRLTGSVSLKSHQGAAVGLKCRLISLPKKNADGEEECHGEMNDLIEAVVKKNGKLTTEFEFPYDLRSWFEQQGGVLAAVTRTVEKVRETFQTSNLERDYFLDVQCNVSDHWDAPSDRVPVSVKLKRESSQAL